MRIEGFFRPKTVTRDHQDPAVRGSIKIDKDSIKERYIEPEISRSN